MEGFAQDAESGQAQEDYHEEGRSGIYSSKPKLGADPADKDGQRGKGVASMVPSVGQKGGTVQLLSQLHSYPL